MRLYHVLSRIFPRSFGAKVFLIAVLGTHLPVIVAVFLSKGGPDEPPSPLHLAIAFLLGAMVTFAALRAVLLPLFMVAQHLAAWDGGHHPGRLPEGYRDEVGRLMHHANLLMDRAARRLDQSRAEAETDPLTGVLNRRGAERWLAEAEPGWVLQIDVDHFKAVNDRWGHEAGDATLVRVARAAASALRRIDMIARFGGEEFVAFLDQVGAEEAHAIAERVRRAVEEQARLGRERVTVSIGLAPHAEGANIEAALAEADRALYRAKRTGRNRVCDAQQAAAAA